jgi:hypothetical protein
MKNEYMNINEECLLGYLNNPLSLEDTVKTLIEFGKLKDNPDIIDLLLCLEESGSL